MSVLVAASAQAQQGLGSSAESRGGWVVKSAVSASISYSDNRDLAPVDRHGELLTIVTPSVRMTAQTERLRGALDYSLSAIASTGERDRNDIQHALSASFVAEPVLRTAYIEARANVSQQTLSAFGLQSPGGTPSLAVNRTEVRSLSVSPYVRGTVGEGIALEARVSLNRTNADQQAVSASTSRVTTFSAGNSRGTLRWTATASESVNDYDRGRETVIKRLDASIEYTPHYDWRLRARLGRETNDVLSVQTESSNSWGVGLRWNPSVRTDLEADIDQRYFGRSHNLAFSYRTPRTVWRLSDSRGSSNSRQGGVDVAFLDTYDRLFRELAALYPDPAIRDRVIRELLVRDKGLLSNALTLSRQQSMSGAWNGLRASATLALFRTRTSRLDAVSSVSDDLSRADRVDQSGFSLSLGYRLTQTGQLSVALSRTHTADQGVQRGNTMNSAAMSWVAQLWSQASMSVSLRRTQFEGPVPYTEHGASMSLSLQF